MSKCTPPHFYVLPARSYRTSVPAMATLERVVSENLHILPSVVLVYTAGIGMADNLAVFVFRSYTAALGIDLGILNEAVSDSSTCDLAYQSAGTFFCCFDNRVGNTAVLYDESIVAPAITPTVFGPVTLALDTFKFLMVAPPS